MTTMARMGDRGRELVERITAPRRGGLTGAATADE
jgi:hypothetical protein